MLGYFALGDPFDPAELLADQTTPLSKQTAAAVSAQVRSLADGGVTAIDGEDVCLELARHDKWPTGVIYWSAEGARDELARLAGQPTQTDLEYARAAMPKPPGVGL